jgi:hypothetical protein
MRMLSNILLPSCPAKTDTMARCDQQWRPISILRAQAAHKQTGIYRVFLPTASSYSSYSTSRDRSRLAAAPAAYSSPNTAGKATHIYQKCRRRAHSTIDKRRELLFQSVAKKRCRLSEPTDPYQRRSCHTTRNALETPKRLIETLFRALGSSSYPHT